jgi:4-diphosphocytidyl-2-C-methyl-D-erythritol kinase
VSADTLTEFAPAKVNLTLRVGCARPDGFHPLDSLVVFAEWGDEVRVKPASGLMLSMSGEPSRDLDAGGDNLVMRAARTLQQAAGVEAGAMIHLHKEIPVEAGLGGGSADAAATLRVLNRLWGVNWPLDRLAQIGLPLGADIPACVYSRPLRMRGAGEWVEVMPVFPEFPAVILNPGVAMPTGSVFSAFDATGPDPLQEQAECGDDFMGWLAAEPNDLESSAAGLVTEIAASLDWLRGQDGVRLARMSGSGASCFALCESSEAAIEIASRYDGFAIETRFSGARPTQVN